MESSSLEGKFVAQNVSRLAYLWAGRNLDIMVSVGAVAGGLVFVIQQFIIDGAPANWSPILVGASHFLVMSVLWIYVVRSVILGRGKGAINVLDTLRFIAWAYLLLWLISTPASVPVLLAVIFSDPADSMFHIWLIVGALVFVGFSWTLPKFSAIALGEKLSLKDSFLTTKGSVWAFLGGAILCAAPLVIVRVIYQTATAFDDGTAGSIYSVTLPYVELTIQFFTYATFTLLAAYCGFAHQRLLELNNSTVEAQ